MSKSDLDGLAGWCFDMGRAPEEQELLVYRHDGNAPWCYGFRVIASCYEGGWYDGDGGEITTPVAWAPLLPKPAEPTR